MSFYFRKLPSNAPLQDRPLISICPFHLKPGVLLLSITAERAQVREHPQVNKPTNYYLTCISLSTGLSPFMSHIFVPYYQSICSETSQKEFRCLEKQNLNLRKRNFSSVRGYVALCCVWRGL